MSFLQSIALPIIKNQSFWGPIYGKYGVGFAYPYLNQIRASTNKHYDPKWRKQRWEKFLKMELPDFEKMRREQNLTPDEMRAKFKREGELPPRSVNERPILYACTPKLADPYVPAEGDGLASAITTAGAKQRVTEIGVRGKSFLQLRKLRQYEKNFDGPVFCEQALEIYKEANTLLENINENEDRLHELVTERAYPEMTWKLEKKSFRWKFHGCLEPPVVLHIRVEPLQSKEDLFAQVTVRFHTQQTLAIYDRFGRLMYGSESLIKDCLEYVVFEKHIVEEYSRWRIHGKIIAPWLPKQDSILRTIKQPKPPTLSSPASSTSNESNSTDNSKTSDDVQSDKLNPPPALA